MHISDLLISTYESIVFFGIFLTSLYLLTKISYVLFLHNSYLLISACESIVFLFLHISDLLISLFESIVCFFAYFCPTYIYLRKYRIFVCIFLTYLYLLTKVSYFFAYFLPTYICLRKYPILVLHNSDLLISAC